MDTGTKKPALEVTVELLELTASARQALLLDYGLVLGALARAAHHQEWVKSGFAICLLGSVNTH